MKKIFIIIVVLLVASNVQAQTRTLNSANEAMFRSIAVPTKSNPTVSVPISNDVYINTTPVKDYSKVIEVKSEDLLMYKLLLQRDLGNYLPKPHEGIFNNPSFKIQLKNSIIDYEKYIKPIL